ncbi:bifunctional serine/threonine-protein kinase/formylglycine-generating enzyme family protein [Isosphaeraceae bacterium EP7]
MRSEIWSPPPRPIPGYEIVRPLGGGGMGVVYLARQISLGRVVAIKLLANGPDSSLVSLARRFRREAELMARIRHPNIVSIHEFGEVDGLPFLVMEYVEGNDLRHSMVEGTPLEILQVRSLIAPLVSALDCLHKHGILHRDFKPENIIIGPGFTPMVSDFGISVEYATAGSLTKGDQWFGTIGYVAPEQQYRLNVDERADQYSMAAVMYEALTGQKPLGVFKPPSQLNRRLDERVDEVLMRALQEDRDDRFPTIVGFGTALEAALAPPPARRPPAGRRSLRIAAIALLPLIGIAWWILRHREVVVVSKPGKGVATRLSKSLDLSFVFISPGEFTMGSPDSDPLASVHEMPPHPVKIARSFYLSTCEITVGQFRRFVEATGYRSDAEAQGRGGYLYDAQQEALLQHPHYLWSSPTGDKSPDDDEPVVQVSWNDAVAFCAWLSKADRRTYRLPTEAEWEYACRAGKNARWCMGDDVGELGTYAWTEENSGMAAHPVGLKRANDFGLYDMHGNVWEWTQDRFASYEGAPAAAPPGAAPPVERTLRGGSWEKGELMQTRSGARRDSPPDYAYFTYGFRVCAPL